MAGEKKTNLKKAFQRLSFEEFCKQSFILFSKRIYWENLALEESMSVDIWFWLVFFLLKDQLKTKTKQPPHTPPQTLSWCGVLWQRSGSNYFRPFHLCSLLFYEFQAGRVGAERTAWITVSSPLQWSLINPQGSALKHLCWIYSSPCALLLWDTGAPCNGFWFYI